MEINQSGAEWAPRQSLAFPCPTCPALCRLRKRGALCRKTKDVSICQRQLQPARNTWRGAPPGHASRGKWPLEKPRLVHRSYAFFSANKAWSGVSSQSPCLFREEGHSQWDFCPPTHTPPPTALFSVTSLWNVGSPMGFWKLYLERCGRGENTGWQAHAVQAFDNTGTPQAGPGPDGSSGLVTLTRRKDRLGLWDLRGRPASSMGSQEVSQAEPGTEVQRREAQVHRSFGAAGGRTAAWRMVGGQETGGKGRPGGGTVYGEVA